MGSAGVDLGQAGDGGGSDGIQAAVALRVGAALIALDREQHERVGQALTARTPAEALAGMG